MYERIEISDQLRDSGVVCAIYFGRAQQLGYPMSEQFTFVAWKLNENLYYWRGTYWRWVRSPMHKDDPPHVFEELTDEHKDGWHLD